MTQMGVGDPGMPFSEYEKVSPIAQMSLHSQVVAPISAAVVSGILVGILALVASLYFNWSMWVPVVAWIVATALAWFAYFSLSTGLLKTVEKMVGIDIDQDGRVGEPQELRIEVTEPKAGGGRMQFLTIEDVDADTLKYWAKAVSTGDSLGVGRWVGRGAPFTRTQYDRMMSEFTRAGLIVDHGGNIGRQLTRVGRTVLRGLGD